MDIKQIIALHEAGFTVEQIESISGVIKPPAIPDPPPEPEKDIEKLPDPAPAPDPVPTPPPPEKPKDFETAFAEFMGRYDRDMEDVKNRIGTAGVQKIEADGGAVKTNADVYRSAFEGMR